MEVQLYLLGLLGSWLLRNAILIEAGPSVFSICALKHLLPLNAGRKWECAQRYLEHGPGMFCIGGSVPLCEPGCLSLCYQVLAHLKEALPLHVHTVLLVPHCTSPAQNTTSIQ